MSWNDVFPIFSDEKVSEYLEGSTSQEKAEIRAWFDIKETFNARSSRHLVVANLFWKNLGSDDADLPPITRDSLINARRLGLVSRHDPWFHYVVPLLEGAKILRSKRPDIVFRVYLAADLEFLVPDLVEVGCEVCLMVNSSIRHNPGAMWRFLAMEEDDRWITVVDSDRAPHVLHDVDRTERIISQGLGFWRAPYVFDGPAQNDHPGFYRTAIACHFGALGGYAMKLLLESFIWHTIRGTIDNECVVQLGSEEARLPIFGTKWPDYGFDEWFLNSAMYPRLALTGVATFFPHVGSGIIANQWFALDLEYVTWANPKSEVIFFGSADCLDRIKGVECIEQASSPIVSEIIRLSRRERYKQISPPPSEPSSRLTVVVARFREDLKWLLHLPPDATVVVYNKGDDIEDQRVLKRISKLEALPNRGREADTFLHHIENYVHDSCEHWTVFSQGDPLPHSPSFISLLQNRDAWSDVQSLTYHYLDDGHTPPQILKDIQGGEWIRGNPVRTELSSAWSLENLHWRDDEGSYRCFRDYARFYGVPRGWSLAAHFLENCGLDELARRAWSAVAVRYCYAAVFGVRNKHLNSVPRECIPRMRKLSYEHYSGPWMYERLWLHIFGLPFA